MSKTDAGTWSRLGEIAVLALAFLAPLAAHGRTYDPSALRVALLEGGALTLGLALALKGLARGRWEAAAPSGAVLAPLAALALWTLGRFAFAPYKLALLPDLALALSAWVVGAVALLELGGARHAARLAFWTAAAAAAAGAAGVARRLAGGDPASLLGGPEALASFAAAALPVVLSLRLDPEATAVRRTFSAGAALLLALLAGGAGSGRGLAAFVLAALAFAAVAAGLLRGPEARRTALLALGPAALAVVVALASGAARDFTRPAFPSDPVGAALLAGTSLAALAVSLSAAWDLRRRGALAEAGYAAGFSAAFGAWSLASALGLVPALGVGAWLAWAAGGIGAGLSPLSRPRGLVRTLPISAGEDVRRLLQGPVFLAFAALAVWPAQWLASDVRYNRALAEARSGSADAALADAAKVWPGAAVYAPSLYLRGRVLMDQGRPQEALAAYARLDGVAPDFARVHARRADAYAALGDWSSAARERARQADLSPLSVPDLVAWSEAARASGDLATARLAADRAGAIAPDDAAVREQVAANSLLEKRLAAQDGARKKNGRRTALRSKTR